LPLGQGHFKACFKGEYVQQTIVELFEELKSFIENLTVENVIYRSNHVSNNFSPEGVLSKDSKTLLKQIEDAIKSTPEDMLPGTSSIL